jgi:hypothetical protein
VLAVLWKDFWFDFNPKVGSLHPPNGEKALNRFNSCIVHIYEMMALTLHRIKVDMSFSQKSQSIFMSHVRRPGPLVRLSLEPVFLCRPMKTTSFFSFWYFEYFWSKEYPFLRCNLVIRHFTCIAVATFIMFVYIQIFNLKRNSLDPSCTKNMHVVSWYWYYGFTMKQFCRRTSFNLWIAAKIYTLKIFNSSRQYWGCEIRYPL